MSAEVFKHVKESIHRLLAGGKSERALFIKKGRFVTYARAKRILNKLEYLVYAPKTSRAHGLILAGPPGAGKTALMLALQRRALRHALRNGHSNCKPVVNIDMSNAREARTIFNRTLEALGAPISAGMRIPDREQLALRLLRQADAKLLALDEIQSVLKATDYQQKATLDTVKLIMNSLSLPILGTGDKYAVDAFRSDPHLKARFSYEELPAWQVDNESRDFLAALEKHLPLRNPSYLSSPSLHAYLINKSEGNLSSLITLIQDASLFAIDGGEECISKTLIERAANEAPPAYLLKGDDEPSNGGDK